MLRSEEISYWAGVFGVADEQVRRDHLVSHVLATVGSLDADGLVFYGGTALARTYLPRFRLSEDIDLLAAPRSEWASRIERVLPAALRRNFGEARWRPGPTDVPDATAAVLIADGLRVRIQIVSLDAEQRRWPVGRRALEMRYADAPDTTMTVPTLTTFAAMKTIAWEDRKLARDLADLAALAELGALDTDAAFLVRKMAGWRPYPTLYERLPNAIRDSWQTDLGHQMAHPPDPDACLDTVRTAWSTALGWG